MIALISTPQCEKRFIRLVKLGSHNTLATSAHRKRDKVRQPIHGFDILFKRYQQLELVDCFSQRQINSVE